MLEIAAIYFGAGALIVTVILIIARLGAGEIHGSFWPWGPINFLIMVALWPALVFLVVAGEINSRRAYAKAERELQAAASLPEEPR